MIPLHKEVIQIEKGMLVNVLETLSISSFTISSAKFSGFDVGNVILFSIKVSNKNIKETTLARYFIKVTECPSFTRIGVISQINRVQ